MSQAPTAVAQRHMIIDGKEVDAASGETFTTSNPATGAVLARLPSGGAEDVDRAVNAADRAFEGGAWKKLHARERGKILFKIAAAIRSRVDEIAEIQTRDNGKTITESRGEVSYAADVFEYYGGAANKIFGKTIPVAADGLDFTLREPLGVTAAIIPWNGPFAISAYKVAPALATGNTVVLKPPSLAPLSALELGRIGIEVGLPNGVLNVVTGGGGTAGNALVEHPKVAFIGFTGETTTGQQIVRKYLTTETHAYLFSPARDMEARKQEMRTRRKTKVQPTKARQKPRRKRKKLLLKLPRQRAKKLKPMLRHLL